MDQLLSTVIVTVIACIGFAACLYLMQFRTVPALAKLCPDFKLPDMRLHYDAPALFDTLEQVGAQGQALLKRYWLTDFGFIACFLVIMLVVTFNNAPLEPIRNAMYIAAILRAALDMTENLLLLSVTAAYPAKMRRKTATVAGFVTSAKFLALGLWLLGLFASLLMRGLAMGK